MAIELIVGWAGYFPRIAKSHSGISDRISKHHGRKKVVVCTAFRAALYTIIQVVIVYMFPSHADSG